MSLKDDILIEQFFKNELSEIERKSFLERVESDDVFKEQYLLEKQLFESLNSNNWSFVSNVNTEIMKKNDEIFRTDKAKSLQKTLSEVHIEYKKSIQVKKRRLFYISGIAASILFVITLNLFKTNNNNTTDFYNNYIMLHELPSFVTRGEVSDKNKLVDAESYFKKKEYQKAIATLESVKDDSVKDGNFYIYQAVSLLELNKYDKAEKVLNYLIHSDLIDAPKGYWYKALLYLKSKRLNKAKTELKMLMSTTNFKQKEAKELLEEL